jgi:hypothetical protein
MHDITRGVTSRVRRGVGAGSHGGRDPTTTPLTSDPTGGNAWVGRPSATRPSRSCSMAPPGVIWFRPADGRRIGRHLLCTPASWHKPDLFVWSEDDGWVNLTNTPDVWELADLFAGRTLDRLRGGRRPSESRVYVRPFLRDGPAIQVSTTEPCAALVARRLGTLLQDPAWNSPCGTPGRGRSGTTETQRWVMAAPVTYSDSGIDIGRPERLFRADDYVQASSRSARGTSGPTAAS